MTSEQEKLILLPEDLIIDPFKHGNRGGSGAPLAQLVLAPWQIPIAPAVYASENTYKPGYTDEIISGLLASVQSDIEAIEEITKQNLGIKIDGNEIASDRGRIKVGSFTYSRDTTKKFIDMDQAAVGITLEHHSVHEGNFLEVRIPGNHPMKPEKLVQFIEPKPPTDLNSKKRWAPTWKMHNYFNLGFAATLLMRNFAIRANNLYFEKQP